MAQKPGGLPQTAIIVLAVLFTIAMTLIFVFVFLFRYRRRRRRRVSVNDDNGSARLGMFNFTRRRSSFRTSADGQSSIWWGGGSVRSDDEATVPPSIISFDGKFVDHDGSTVRGERLTKVRKSLLREYHRYRP